MKREPDPRGRPACPCCGEPYDEFVWKEGEWADGPEREPDSECESALGWWVH